MNNSMSCEPNTTSSADIWITVLTFATLVLTALLGLYKARKIRQKSKQSPLDEEMGDASLSRMGRRIYKIHHNVESILEQMGLSKTSDPS